MFKNYRKKPIVVKAVQIKDLDHLVDLSNNHNAPILFDQELRSTQVSTLEGRMDINIGDWLVVGVDGEHYPVKDHIFKKTYEPVWDKSLGESGKMEAPPF